MGFSSFDKLGPHADDDDDGDDDDDDNEGIYICGAQELQSLSPGSWLLSSYPLHLSIISVIRNLSQKASFFYKALSNTNSHHLHLQRHDH